MTAVHRSAILDLPDSWDRCWQAPPRTSAALLSIRQLPLQQWDVCGRLTSLSDAGGHAKTKGPPGEDGAFKCRLQRESGLSEIPTDHKSEPVFSNSCVSSISDATFSPQSNPHCLTWSLSNGPVLSEVWKHLNIMCSYNNSLIASQQGLSFQSGFNVFYITRLIRRNTKLAARMKH